MHLCCLCDLFVQSVQQKRFDHVSAIYHLLVDKMEATAKPYAAVLKNTGKYGLITFLKVLLYFFSHN